MRGRLGRHLTSAACDRRSATLGKMCVELGVCTRYLEERCFIHVTLLRALHIVITRHAVCSYICICTKFTL